MAVRQLAQAAIVLLLFAHAANAQDVVFSRREYAAAGQTYQQLWMWNTVSGAFTRLTGSPRDHNVPACSKDGMAISFLVGEPFGPGDPAAWTLDRKTGAERHVKAPSPSNRPPSMGDLSAQLSLGSGICHEAHASPD